MSARALRALRGDPVAAIPTVGGEEEEEEEEVESVAAAPTPKFAIMMTNEFSSSTEDEEESDEEDQGEMPLKTEEASEVASEEEKAEDLDALLREFEEKDSQLFPQQLSGEGATSESFSPSAVLLAGLDTRDLDFEASMRNALLGGASEGPTRRVKGVRLLFGPPLDGWVSPPRYVGGGMGMTTYDQEVERKMPCPYNRDSGGEDESDAERKRWFAFQHSDSYQRDCDDYGVVKQSGAVNDLLMFVAHHPFVTSALLQLSTALYQTNHSQEGLALLRRCLWIYEKSALLSFTKQLNGNALMDGKQPENATFFLALYQLIRVSYMAGLQRTSLAVSRFLLSLDPLRDPMGVLLAMDHYALASALETSVQFLVNVVESNQIRMWFQEEEAGETYECCLRELPNWEYSYAFALFQLNAVSQSDDTKMKADVALQEAMSRFPSIVGLLLQKLEVDTTGRSFRRDWGPLLDFATERYRQLLDHWVSDGRLGSTIILSDVLATCDIITRIFVQLNYKLWGDEDVLQWMHDNLQELSTNNVELPSPPNPALLRYADVEPSDYDKIETLPEANLIDPGLIQHAMAMNPNRPRFLRHGPRGGAVDGVAALDGQPRQQAFMGPPTHNIDPDWPAMEVFLRAILPWNHVVGVPPPRR